MNALLVKDEALRSQALEQKKSVYREPDPILKDLVMLASQICDTPVAVVWLAGPDGVDLRAAVGITAASLTRETVPCEDSMRWDEVFELSDTRLAPEFAPDGLSMEGQCFCFYAAVPLNFSSGDRAGALAVLDLEPRRLTESQAESLRLVGRQAATTLEWQEQIQQLTQAVRSKEPDFAAPATENGLPSAAGDDTWVQTDTAMMVGENEAKYRQIVESSLGIVFRHDLDGKLLSLNTHGASTLGRSVEDMVGCPLEQFVPVKRRNTIREYLKTVATTGEAQGLLHLLHGDGDVRVVAYRNKLIAESEVTPYVLGFGVDITEQVKAEKKLRTLTRQSDSILESVGDGIFCIDREGKVTVVNAAAAQMLGYRQEEMLGKEMHSLIHHTRPDGSAYVMDESPIRKSISNFGAARVRDEVFWRQDGTSFPVEYVARPLIDANSNESGGVRALGVVVAFTDTTDRKALDQMKDEFISTVSHELRTPLTSLRGALGLLSGGALETRPEKSQQMLEIAISNADRLIRLVNDIVDLERISSGKNELHMAAVRARELLHGAVNICEAQMPGSSARILLRPTEVNVWADSERVLQVLNNLLSNAFKFSEPDGEIYMSARNIDDQEALFEIQDHGRGIPADKLERIFERFHQGDASDSRALGGTGLGLTICRRIVTLHGGRIWATSTPGKGTTVHFTLPTRPRMNLR